MRCPNCQIEIDCSTKNKFCVNIIPKTFAKKNLLKTYNKLIGKKKRSMKDHLAYIERLNNITDMKLGEFEVIEKARKDGENGTDTRDVFNWAVCRGLILKKQKNKSQMNKNEFDYYERFERIEKKPCKFLKTNNQIPFCSFEDYKFLTKKEFEELNNGY